MKHKKLVIAITAVFSVIIFLGIFLMIWFAGTYTDFNRFRPEFEIPGLDDGAVPQGIGTYFASYEVTDEEGKTATKTQSYFLISAYMTDDSPSRIYVTGKDTGYVGYVTMKDEDGNDFYGHCGGIATNGSTLWVTGEGMVHVAKVSDSKAYTNVLKEIVDKAAARTNGPAVDEDGNTEEVGEDAYSVKFTASFNANCNASFCYYFDDSRYSSVTYDRLYVGEFYRSGNYETDKSHKITTPSGYQNNAVMYEYNVSSSTDFGLVTLDDTYLTDENIVPKIQKIFSLPEKIQGVAWSGRAGYGTTDGLLILSQSYGLANSHILCFDWATVSNSANRKLFTAINGSSFTYDGVYKTAGGMQTPYTDKSLYVYYVDKGDSSMLVNDYSIPSMSEGMCVITPSGANSGAMLRVYLLFESASDKYKAYVRKSLGDVYSFIPHKKR